MTPNNIVSLSRMLGLSIIALTDHNTCGNVRAIVKAAQKYDDIIIIPGMELETAENVHILLYFPDVDAAEECSREVYSRLIKVPNNEAIFGCQKFFDEADCEIGREPNLLVNATDIGVYEAARLAASYGGIAVPAHIDKESNGLIAILGGMDKDMGFGAVEVSANASKAFIKTYSDLGYGILHNSDSHYLDSLNDLKENFFALKTLSLDEVFKAIKDITMYKEIKNG